MSDHSHKVFNPSDTALVAYAVAFNIDLFKYEQSALVSFYNEDSELLDLQDKEAINNLYHSLVASTTFDMEDSKTINEFIRALLKFRIGIAIPKLLKTVSVENKQDINSIFSRIFGTNILPPEFETALLNGKGGDTSKIHYYRGMMDMSQIAANHKGD